MGQAAYITPDQDPLKSHFNSILNHNLDWYNANYTNNASANNLGIITNGYAVVYDNGVGVGPWQDDFFTSAVGYMADLGFDKAKQLLTWKAKFPIGRMTGAGYCWIDGSIYALKVRDSVSSPIYSTIGQAYAASHTSAFNALALRKPGNGGSAEPEGRRNDGILFGEYRLSLEHATGTGLWRHFGCRPTAPKRGRCS